MGGGEKSEWVMGMENGMDIIQSTQSILCIKVIEQI